MITIKIPSADLLSWLEDWTPEQIPEEAEIADVVVGVVTVTFMIEEEGGEDS